MKIFNWVHKRLHHRVLKDGFAGDVKKTEFETSDKDTQAFLKQVGLVNLDGLDSWRDGILTIGTFGLESLKPFDHQNEYLVLESEEDDKESHGFSHSGNDDDDDDDHDDDDEHYDHNVEDEELNPLLFTTFGHSSDDIGSNSCAIVDKPADAILTVNGVHLNPFEGSNEISLEPDLYHLESTDHQMKKRGQRITLADLFQADVLHDVDKLKLDSCKVQPEMQKKVNVRTRSGLAFAKKFIPRVNEDSNPIRNLQQLMRRMLKRKIHPAELDGQKQPSAELITTVGNDASESVRLLPIQGATCVH